MQNDAKNFILSNNDAAESEKRLNLLYEIGRILASTETMREAAPQILEGFCRHLQFDIGELWSLNESGTILRLESVWHLKLEPLERFISDSKSFEFSVGEGLPGRVWQNNAPVWIENLSNENDLARRDFAECAGMQSAFSFPITLGEKFLGAFCFFCKNLCPQDAELLKMFTAVGGNIGHFIKRERVEKDLRESSAILQTINQSSPTLIYLKDRAGRILTANPATLAVINKTLSETVGKTHAEYTGNKIEAALIAENDRRIIEGGATETFEEKVIKEGVTRTFFSTKAPYRNENGEIIGLVGVSFDITERKQAQVALEDARTRLESTLAAAEIGTWTWDCVNDSVVADKNLAHLFSVSEADATGGKIEKYLTAIHKDDRARVAETIRQAMESADHYEAVYRLVQKDAAVRWVSARGKIVRDETGAAVSLPGVVIDITETKASEEKLRESEERFRTLFNSIDEGFGIVEVVFDDAGQPFDHRIVDANPGFENHSGIKNPIGKKSGELVPGVEQHWNDIYGQVIRTGKSVSFEQNSKDLQRWFDVFITRIGDETSNKAAIIFNDITERKRIEEDLRESRRRLDTALKAGKMGSWELNLITREFIVSDVCKINYGRQPEDPFTYRNLADSIFPDDRAFWRETVELAVQQASEFEIEYRVRWLDDSIHWVLVRGDCLTDEAGETVSLAGISLDITERKEVEVERERLLQIEQQAREISEQANHAKDEFIALVSHELRSPLNAMLGWTRILQKKTADQKTSDYALDVIARNALLQSRLIEDLLDIARLGKGKLRLELAPLEFIPIINAAIESIKPAAAAKNINLTQVLDDEANLITGDSDRLRQVIENLLSNAVKFMPDGGSVSIRLEREEARAKLIISDTGQGISAEFLPQIFERFKQADPSATRRHGGLGIGLSLARDLVELHGGTISAQSAGEGAGATFTVTLPLRAVRPIKENISKVKNMDSQGKLSGFWILAVDDEADAREIISFMLQINGARVTSANSAVEALEILKNAEDRIPDILLSDISMPFESGYALLEKIRALPREHGGQIPAVALTAFNRPEDREAAYEAGFQKHLGKPVDMDALIDAIVETARVKQI